MITLSNQQAVFIDTSGWLALANKDDRWYRLATQTYANLKKASAKLITTDAVILEIGNAFRTPKYRHLAVNLVNNLYEANLKKHIHLVHVTTLLLQKGFELFSKAKDKNWSITDCVSFILMRQMRIKTALTSDHHFEQAGFEILLKGG